MKYYEHISHPFEPVYNRESRILILGSLPSVKSREEGFYYGHPRNRLWSVLAQLYDEATPIGIKERKDFLLEHGIAMWDVIGECDIIGSSDSSIKNAVPTDISAIVANSAVKHIYCNGKTAGKLYEKYQKQYVGMEATVLPSTSPANAACSMERLLKEWELILKTDRFL